MGSISRKCPGVGEPSNVRIAFRRVEMRAKRCTNWRTTIVCLLDASTAAAMLGRWNPRDPPVYARRAVYAGSSLKGSVHSMEAAVISNANGAAVQDAAV